MRCCVWRKGSRKARKGLRKTELAKSQGISAWDPVWSPRLKEEAVLVELLGGRIGRLWSDGHLRVIF